MSKVSTSALLFVMACFLAGFQNCGSRHDDTGVQTTQSADGIVVVGSYQGADVDGCRASFYTDDNRIFQLNGDQVKALSVGSRLRIHGIPEDRRGVMDVCTHGAWLDVVAIDVL